MLIGLAIAVKVTPVVFATYLEAPLGGGRVGHRRGRVRSLAVPAMVFGWDQNLRWLHQWGGIMIVPYVTHGTVVYAMSQSFGSFARGCSRRRRPSRAAATVPSSFTT